MNELWRYYNSKTTLNVYHTENMIDMFRFCVRKDRVLSQALNSDCTSFDLEAEQTADMAETKLADETSQVAPQPGI